MTPRSYGMACHEELMALTYLLNYLLTRRSHNFAQYSVQDIPITESSNSPVYNNAFVFLVVQ